MRAFILKHWYNRHLTWLAILLLPVSLLFGVIVRLRRLLYRFGILKSKRFNTPVIVIGNITVGGTGKTPLVIWLANFLREKGYHPGIISRGYGSRPHARPYFVTVDSSVEDAGDEPLMIAQNTNCPVAIFPDRVRAVAALLEKHDCDMIISDDGLQHYPLARSLEIAVIDGERDVGNGMLLPAGPLREPVTRLGDVDIVIVNQAVNDGRCQMRVVSERLVPLHDRIPMRDIQNFTGIKVHAVAGIGNPDRFFTLLKKMGMDVIEHAFPDHHLFQSNDFNFNDGYPVLMTEKDAVKCKMFNIDNCWYLKVKAEPCDRFVSTLKVWMMLPKPALI